MMIKFCALLLVGLASAHAPVLAQQWPTKPVKLLVGSSPGGGTDAMARAVADKLTPMWGQTVVVENKPGASNTLAADLTAKSTDDQTMLMGVSTAQAIAPHLLKLNYNNDKDLIPVAFTGAVPNVLVVAANSPVNSVDDLIKLLKSKPGQLNFASSGAGSTQHIAAELFKDLAKVDAVHVPYKGSGPAMIDLIAGQVQYAFETMSSALPQIRAGKLKALGVASEARNPQLPDTPTMTQAGVPLVMSAWYGVYMPAKTPQAVIQKVNADVNTVLTMPDTKKRLETIGATITPMSQTQFKAFHDAENKRYADVIKKNNIQVN
jgi:tripartite-type tricarboxylate transporter receptor subunit TctC